MTWLIKTNAVTFTAKSKAEKNINQKIVSDFKINVNSSSLISFTTFCIFTQNFLFLRKQQYFISQLLLGQRTEINF
uniref:Uncharacterized protein n=1 Tax=Onchocerca volvulus TaxID=6282 RepID=A0A8R1TTL7_ONCVO